MRVIVVLALAVSACAPLAHRLEARRMWPHFTTCPDGDAVRLLVDAKCPGGVCGFSCLPGRWTKEE